MQQNGGDVPDVVAADWLTQRWSSRGKQGIAESMVALIRQGTLRVGTRLPTVRDIAEAGGISQGTVAAAWNSLRLQGYVETHRRGGSFVRLPSQGDSAPQAAERGWNFASTESDTSFQPALEGALMQGLAVQSLHSPRAEHIIEPLVAAVGPTWPFKPEAWTTAGGVSEGILLAILAACDEGQTIAVESPTSPRIIRMLSLAGARTVAVGWDRDGPRIDDLHRAIGQGAKVFLYQPRCHFPLARTVTHTRLGELADLLGRHDDVLVIEDDGFGPLAGPEQASLGPLLAGRVILSRAYCKAYGIDLRVSILGGPATLIEKIRLNRSFGTAMTSRILQGTVAALIESRPVGNLIQRARTEYTRRRQMFADALSRRGFAIEGSSGFSIWLPVAADALVLRLNARGIMVTPGSSCTLDGRFNHICLATNRLSLGRPEIERLADAIQEAAFDRSIEEYA